MSSSSTSLTSYVQLPSAGYPIPPPRTPIPSHHPAPSSFPPAFSSSSSLPPPRKFSTTPSSNSLSSNVSDLLLSSLLPANIPKHSRQSVGITPNLYGSGVGGASGDGEDVVRPLTTQKEGLGLNVMSNNFRRFVTKVGPIFWLQDRIEEVLFWRKPEWTCLWILFWTFTCFQPRTLLFVPSISLLLLLYAHEVRSPLPSLLGSGSPPVSETKSNTKPSTMSGRVSASMGQSGSGSSDTSATVANGVISDPPDLGLMLREAESGSDYYMNLQAIQNLMGVVSDIHDFISPKLNSLSHPSPTTFPFTPSLIVLLLFPTLLLPFIPAVFIPYLLLPIGIAPPLLFHPRIARLLGQPLPSVAWPLISRAEHLALDDGLDDVIASRPIGKVEVWENERLEKGSWGKNLKAGERAWVKLREGPALIRKGYSEEGVDLVVSSSLWADDDHNIESSGDGGRVALALQCGWKFIPREDWRVDTSSAAVDLDGWIYLDDSWSSISGDEEKGTTRRRKWYRRVYYQAPGVVE